MHFLFYALFFIDGFPKLVILKSYILNNHPNVHMPYNLLLQSMIQIVIRIVPKHPVTTVNEGSFFENGNRWEATHKKCQVCR